MKLIKKLTIFTTALFLSSAVVFAQEDFSDDFDDFGDDSALSSGDSPISIGGDVSAAVRAYPDLRNKDGDKFSIQQWETAGIPSAKLNFNYSGNSTALSMKLKFDKFSLGDYKEDILDEFVASAFLGNFQLEAGKMRLVWGKTDKLHVLDNFNANDYTDYIIPDYIDRRISELMFHVVYSTPSSVKLEAVYTPWMTPDRLGSGVWTPKAINSLTGAIEPNVKAALAAKDTAAVNAKLLAARIQGLKDTATLNGTLAAKKNAEVAAESDTTAKANLIQQAAIYKGLYDDAMAEISNIVQDEANVAAFGGLRAKIEAKVKAKESDITALVPTYIAQGKSLEEAKALATNDIIEQVKPEAIAECVENNIKTAETEFLTTLTNASGFSANDLYPDTHSLEYGQGGARITFTAGPVDLGFSYYIGHLKQPSVNKYMLSNFDGDTTKITGGKLLHYDRVHIFGFEGAYVIPGIGLNTRWEFAYNMTEDFDGDDPTVANHSLNWVFGFDRDLPLHNININIQTQGKYILNNDKIDNGDSTVARAHAASKGMTYPISAVKDDYIKGGVRELDVDFVRNKDGDGVYTNNKIVLDITDTWNYEKIKLDVKAIWGIERGDLLIMPDLTFKLADSFALDFSGLIILCKDSYSEFDGWNHNSFAQISAKYSF